MSLEGLRAWVAEVERKLAKRTRVFLALTVIAIGIAGAAVYLAIDARNSSVSESDVQALQEELEERIDSGGAGAALTPPPELEPEPETNPPQGSGQSNNGGSGGASDGVKPQELLPQAQERSAGNE